MDPLSVTAGTLAVVSTAQKVSNLLINLLKETKVSEQLSTVQLEVEIYTKILEEVGQIALSGTSSLPESARLSLQLCERHLAKVNAEIHELFGSERGWRGKKPASGAENSLVETLKSYRRSVKILRDIVME
jgi:hypothetical protein